MTSLTTNISKTQSVALTDLKQSQVKDIIVLKNNKKNKLFVTPINDKDIYRQNDTMTFSIKPEGYHFIDFNTLCLSWDYGCFCDGTTFVNQNFTSENHWMVPMFGAWSCIKRVELIVGSKVKEDIDHYNILTTFKIIGNLKLGYFEKLNGCSLTVKERAFECYTKGDTAVKFFRYQIPLYGLLEAGGWLPIYNLAEDLRIRITFEKNTRCLMFGDQDWEDGNISLTVKPSYHIKNARLSFNCINVTVGGKLDPIPYTFASKTTDVTQFFWKSGVTTFSSYLQYRKLSVQKLAIIQITDEMWTRDYPTNKATADLFRQEILATYTDGGISGGLLGVTGSYLLKLGGVNYPYQDKVVHKIDMYNNYLEYFNDFDSNTNLSNRTVSYEPFLAGGNSRQWDVGFNFAVCISLQQLPFNNKVLSGINLELTPLHIILQGNHTVNTNVFIFCTQDVIVSFSAGTLNIEN